MGQRSDRLRKLLSGTKKVGDAAQAAYLKNEDLLSELERREHDRARREQERLGRRS